MAAALGECPSANPSEETISRVLLTVAVKSWPLLILRPMGSVKIDTLTCNCSSLGSVRLPRGR